MIMTCLPENEDFICLIWQGPYIVSPDGQILPLEDGQLGRHPAPIDVPQVGVYMVLGDHHVFGSRALLYIGRSIELSRRVSGHESWLSNEWRPEIYFAEVTSKRLPDIERLLIYAHSPPYNSSGVGGLGQMDPALRVWNTGSFFRLLPEVSSSHPWFSEVEDG